MTRAEARELYEYYCQLVKKLMAAKVALLEGGVKSYSIDDRTVTRFDIGRLTDELEDAIKKRDEYEALMNGGSRRKAVGFVPRDW